MALTGAAEHRTAEERAVLPAATPLDDYRTLVALGASPLTSAFGAVLRVVREIPPGTTAGDVELARQVRAITDAYAADAVRVAIPTETGGLP